MTKQPRYVAYYRVSTQRQGQSGLGLEAQQKTVQQWIASRGASLIAPPYVEVESGKRNDRPELDKALKRCRVHKAALIVAKVDRLTRSMSFLTKLLRANVEVVFCDLPAQQGAMGRFMLQQMVAVAELEAGLISERTKAALAAKVERDGQWDRRASHHLVPGAGQAAAVEAVQAKANAFAGDVQEAIEAIKARGVTTAAGIARALNEQGIATPRGGSWQAVQVQRVLARLV